MTSHTAYAATMQSVWFSRDEGASWNRLPTPTGGLYNEARTWCLSTHPDRPGELLAGSDQGLYRYTEETGRFDYIPSPMDSLHILRVAQDPHDADFIVCGTRPAEVFISGDGGGSWTRSALDASTECWFINTARVTSLQFDPFERDTIWMTVEIDGVFVSRDRGRTWTMRIDGLHDNDTHDLVFRMEGGVKTILCSTEDGVHRSTDEGGSWERLDIPQARWAYFRSLSQPAADSAVVVASVGDRPSGEAGQLLVSRDFGGSWAEADMDTPANSTIWSIGTHASDGRLMYCCTIFGQIFKSTDAGASWRKMGRELGEIRMVAWAPAHTPAA